MRLYTQDMKQILHVKKRRRKKSSQLGGMRKLEEYSKKNKNANYCNQVHMTKQKKKKTTKNRSGKKKQQ